MTRISILTEINWLFEDRGYPSLSLSSNLRNDMMEEVLSGKGSIYITHHNTFNHRLKNK